MRRARAASAARCARPLEEEAVAAVVAGAAVAVVVAEAAVRVVAVRVVAVRVVAVRAVYLCLLERVVGVEQVSGLPAAAPQRELRARGLVVRRELGGSLLLASARAVGDTKQRGGINDANNRQCAEARQDIVPAGKTHGESCQKRWF